MNYLEGLNEQQLEAVSETEGYVRVIAGAGSGKTKLLVCRYAYLVKEYGIDASNILCVTFTNKAAAEMKNRIRAMIGEEYETSLVCTYHGFCARMLREDSGKLFLPKSFQIIDATQQKQILGEIYQKRELKLDYASFEKILKQVGEFKSLEYATYVPRICSPKDIPVCQSITTMDEEIIEEYLQRQKSIGALDFHDLISFALYLLESDRAVREKWQERLNYIQVDEFQDSSVREMHLIDILSGGYGNLMIVGDPDQNIYEWRGSDVKLLVDFDKAHTPTQTIFLNRNYRSTPQILKCANTLIAKNTLRLEKDLFTLRSEGSEVIHYHSKSEEVETETIADLIHRDVQERGLAYSDHAILYRSGFLSRVVENRLVEQNIPYEIYGGVKFYQRMEVLDLIAYLRLIAFDDDLSFKRIINKPRRRFGRNKLAALEQLQGTELSLFSEHTHASLFETLVLHVHESPFKSSGAEAFIHWVTQFRSELDGLRITEIVNRASTETGYEQYIRELGDEERYENLMEFKRIADEFERSFGEELTLPEFLQQISLQAGEGTEKERDAVKLMTIHAAKGLEFPVVFTIGLSEGIFPSSKTIEERKLLGLEEERRLCYVAITRAEKQLYLMDSEGLSQSGIKKLPSRFLREIGRDNYRRIGEISKELDQESRAYSRRLDAAFALPEEEGYSEGETVTHHIFGKGRIISADPVRRTIRVQFDSLKMPRNLSLDYFQEKHSGPLKVKGEAQVPAPEVDSLSEAARETLSEAVFEADEGVVSALSPIEKSAVLYPSEKHIESENTSNPAEDPQKIEPQPDKAASPAVVIPKSETEIEDEDIPQEGEEGSQCSDPELLNRLRAADNLWKRDDVPHFGWICTGVTDLGEPAAICEMCGQQIIRYVHHMVHPHYHPISAGCVCAGKMEGDIERARKREQDFKNKQARQASFAKRKWKRSKNGNPYLKIKGHLIVLYHIQGSSSWKYAIDSAFGEETYPKREDAVQAAFQALDKALYGKK